MSNIKKMLEKFGKVKQNELLSKHTTFKIGGPVSYFLITETVHNLVEALKFLDGKGIAYTIVGGGSNMLANDETFDGVVITCKDSTVLIENTHIVASLGIATVSLSRKTMQAGLKGFEWGVGIPGTIGGAVRGNAGASGGEMKDHVTNVEVYRNGEVLNLSAEECKFGYRDSIFKRNKDVILKVHMELEYGENKEGLKKALEYIKYRNETQPQGFASTGCIFKNVSIKNQKSAADKIDLPKDFYEKGLISAGWLIDKAGLKGYQVGNAKVSDKHGNFIINLGKAKASDVSTLIDDIKEKVYNTFGIHLEEEIHRFDS